MRSLRSRVLVARYARESSSLATLANARWVLVDDGGLRGARMGPYISCTAPLRDVLRRSLRSRVLVARYARECSLGARW